MDGERRPDDAGAGGEGGAGGTLPPDAAARTSPDAAPDAPPDILTTAARLEPWLALLAAPLLLVPERIPLPSARTGAPWLPIALGLAWLAMLWALRRRAQGRWSRPLVMDAPTIALLLATLPAIAVAGDRAAAAGRAASLVFAMAMAYAVANHARRPRRAWALLSWGLLAGLAVALVGLVSTDWQAKYAAFAPVLARLPRLIDAIPHVTLGVAAGTPAVGVHPNMLAGLMPVFLLPALALWLWPVRPGPLAPPGELRLLAALALAGCGSVLLLAQSRGAWLATALAALLLAALRWRRRLPATGRRRVGGLTIYALLALAIGAALAATLVLRALPPLDPGAAAAAPGALDPLGRLRLWRGALALLAEHPVAGIGLHNFPLVYGQAEGQPYVYQGYAHAHNLALQTALDFGLPGLVAVTGLAAALAWGAWRAWQRLRRTAMEPLVAGLGCGLLAVGLHGMVDAVAIGARPGFLIWSAAGLLAALRARGHGWADEGDAAGSAASAVPKQGAPS